MLRAKKLKGSGIVRAAAAHNKRAIQAELGAGSSICAARSILNECLAGPSQPEQVAQRARSMMEASAAIPRRKDAVRAIEFVVSLAPDHGIDDRALFVDAVAWLGARFGGADNILSADIHRDEAAPHLHVLLLPLIGGKMQGSDAMGGRAKLAALHADFHAQVATPYGLKRAPARLQGNAKAAASSTVLHYVRSVADAALRSAVWGVIRECIERDPAPFMTALGIVAPPTRAKPLRSMVAIFTSKGKGSDAPEASKPYRVSLAVNK